MSHHPLIRSRFEQGLEAYRAGYGVDHVLEVANEIEAMHDKPDLSAAEHRELSNSIPSFFAGFLNGLVEDVRSMSSNPNLLRRGQKA